MRINSVIAAKAGQLVRASVRDTDSLYTSVWGHFYLPDLVKAIKERYGFVSVPESLFELEVSDTKAAIFQHGKFVQDSRAILISQFEVYRDWIVATTQSSTDDAEQFLSDILAWFSGTFFTVITTISRTTYLSQLEVVLEASFGRTARFLEPAQTHLSQLLASYSNVEPPHIEMSGFSLHLDTTKRPDLVEGSFTIERRFGQPYEGNVYFTQAPLKTRDHLTLLREIETATLAARVR